MKHILGLLLALLTIHVHAALTDIKFGQYQVADSAWDVNACLNTATCQVLSKNPGVAYKIPFTSGQIQWAAGDYIKFSLSGNASFPYTAIQYSSVGATKTTLGNGKIVNMGSDYLFFVGSDNDTGQLFSGSSGMNNTSGVTWTGTRNPTIAQADAIANASYSTEPLSPGQAATTTPNSGGGGSSPVYTSEITTTQTNTITAARSRITAMTSGNKVYLEEKAGTSNSAINIEQAGSFNLVGGIGGGDAVVSGNRNTVSVKQGDTIGRNIVEFSVTGNSNAVTVWQARSVATGLQDGIESGGHYLALGLSGNSNVVSLKQGNDGGASSGHVGVVSVSGNNNSMALTQNGNNDKRFFGVVTGSNTGSSVTQSGLGAHYFDLALTGNGHQVAVTQKDAGSHRATVNLVNAGGASNLSLVQQGSTAQVYNITQQCATLSGCSVSITQGQ